MEIEGTGTLSTKRVTGRSVSVPTIVEERQPLKTQQSREIRNVEKVVDTLVRNII